ncbi:MAG: glycerol-3-phosphate dehydrogenase/oxidase [Deltaproteobacteria bacterium]|nr:glycerol-3-phosphate dehydrogenase/oxidase [Deltaproteobacteria bacterium]
MELDSLPEQWDLVVIGGGITGAGILREAVRAGLKTLLVEKRDFASGTSSRSSKLVHGGLRYLKQGKLFLTKASVEERCRLLNEAPGLVEPLGFLWPLYAGQRPGKTAMSLGLTLYDMLSGRKQHEFLDPARFALMAPHIRQEGLKGGFRFTDAQVDDARLVQRLINEAQAAGGTAVNYVSAVQIKRRRGRRAKEVVGVEVEDTDTQKTRSFSCRAVINATGWWAETIHPSPNPKRHLRPLRGSHLVFPYHKLPVAQAITFIHPGDGRPVFAIPWEGVVLLGTTDVDHREDVYTVPSMSRQERDYLLEAARSVFPFLDLSAADCMATFAGVRPVLSSGKKDPSKESREHVVWVNKGLVTVTGGKLTTFRRLAADALRAVAPFLTRTLNLNLSAPVFESVPQAPPRENRGLSPETWRRLYGRYGRAAEELVKGSKEKDLETAPGTHTLFAELPWAAANESVRHLPDLLLRRTRLGILTPQGAREHLPRVRSLCQPVLGWDDEHWEKEEADYLDLWNRAYSCPT